MNRFKLESCRFSAFAILLVWSGEVRGQQDVDDLLAVTLIKGDHAIAESEIDRFDSNRDGVINLTEMKKLHWLSDPKKYDLNRNDRLTKLEIAIHFANMRKKFSVTVPDTFNAGRIINLYDRNGDRMLSNVERTNSPLLPSVDNNKDGQISVFELAKKFAGDRKRLRVEALDQWNALARLRKLDKDGDQQLDLKEADKQVWSGGAASFDLDKDRHLSWMEIAKGITKFRLEQGIARTDQWTASRFMARYDGNRDGHLDEREIKFGQWPKDPENYDADKDGKITTDEVAKRIAKDRTQHSVEHVDRVEASKLIARYDMNRNGTIDAKELLADRADVGKLDIEPFLEFDFDNNERLSRNEVAAYLARQRKKKED